MTRRVVVTGMGTINPLGLTVSETWENLIHGKSSVGSITLFDSSDLLVHIACEVKGFDPARYMDAREARRRDRFEQFAVAASAEALGQAAFEVDQQNAGRVGVVVSTAVGGLGTMQDSILTMETVSPRRVSPFLIPMFMPNGASGLISIVTGATGPSLSVASACASGADSIGLAGLMIRAGVIDVCIAGGAEATVTKIGVCSFDRVGGLSRRNEDFQHTPSPFDKNRDGLVMAEGAAVLVLESLDHARGRGAEIMAELIGYGSTADAYHVTAPSETGAGGAAAIKTALIDAGLQPEQVDYINAHGTGTLLNDVSETRAIKDALGDHAYRVPVSSTKSMTGHMMGATGALEAIICIQVIRNDLLPPTINLSTPDPDCDLDYVPNQARRHEVRIALSNAFGFGGHNAVLAFRTFLD
jgi:3-oxoacyl-[acyl-carrier-protein] synthase II